MRLYLKLAILIALTCAIQKYSPSNQQLYEYWFGFRCDIATVTHDSALLEHLLDEAGRVRDAEVRNAAQANYVNAAIP